MKKLLSIIIAIAMILGTATVSISPLEVYAADTTDLSNAEVTVIGGPFYANGSLITPDVTVTLAGEEIDPSNYSVTYSNSTYVGTATATVEGKGFYSGTKSVNFEIVSPFKEGHYYCGSMTQKHEEITGPDQCKWVEDPNGNEHSLQCKEHGAVIGYCTSVNNIGGYGSTPCSHELPDFECQNTPEWAGECPLDSCKKYREAAASGKLLCAYSEGENDGEHFVDSDNCQWKTYEIQKLTEVCGEIHYLECNEHSIKISQFLSADHKGVYAYSTGAKRWTVQMDAFPENIFPSAKCIGCPSCTEVTLSQTSYEYDGTAKTPAVTVKYRGQELMQGADYNVTYTNNTKPGTAKVNIIGIGKMEDGDFKGYTGTNSVPFTIEPHKSHTWNDGTVTKEATCTEAGVKTFTCTLEGCDGTKTEDLDALGHDMEVVIPGKPATFTEDGNTGTSKCKVCGETSGIYSVIPKVSTVKLSATSYVYDGGTKQPSVTLVDADGNTVSTYTANIPAGRNVGTYKGTITLSGNYSGTAEVSYTINPKGATIKKPSKGSKSFTAKWKAQKSKMPTARVTGYQIQYSQNPSMAGAKIKTVKVYKKTSKKIKKLKKKKTYYVQVRTYMKTAGGTYYSAWSPTKKVKTR